MEGTRGRVSAQFVSGLVLVLIGALLLLGTLDVVDTGSLWRYFPSVFIVVALWSLVQSRFHNVTGPLVVVAVFGTIQLVLLDVLSPDVVVRWWPLVFVVIGLSIIFGRWRRGPPSMAGSRVSLFALFSGQERRVTSESFEGGDLVAAFGGIEVDLRDATVADPPARIECITLFGGTDIVVPDDWTVQVDVVPVLGAVEDERPRPREGERPDEPTLVVTGLVAFGGIGIKD